MLSRLRKLIFDRVVISIGYEGAARILAPYLVYESKDGKRLLHGWQRSGAWRTSPPPDWANLSLGKITSISPTAEKFEHPHPDYNPRSDRFYRVLFNI